MMTTNQKLAIAVVASSLAGTLGGWGIHAQQNKPAPAYIVSEADAVTDLTTVKKYGGKVDDTLAPFAGHYHFVVSGNKPQNLDGQAPAGVVVIAFDNAEQARAWYDSPAYQAIKPLRLSAVKGRMFLVEGTKVP